MKVALVLCPAWSVLTPPLGVSYIAASLIEEGHQVKVFDANVECWQKYRDCEGKADLWHTLNAYDWMRKDDFYAKTFPGIKEELFRQFDKVVEYQPEVIGFGLFDTSVLATREAAHYFRKHLPNTKIVFGGAGANIKYFEGDLIEGLIDVIAVGEGELTIKEVVSKIEQGMDFKGVAGTYHADEGKRVKKELIRSNINMDDLPMPYFEDFDLQKYRRPTLPIMMSRGCIAKCTFCGETQYWRKFRYRSSEHIFRELKLGFEKVGERGFFEVSDSLINGNMEELESLVDKIIASGLHFYWGGYARVDDKLTPEFCEKLAKSGCAHLSFGVESGSQKIVDLMRKQATIETARNSIRNTRNAGIDVVTNIIVGFPGEEEEDFQMTMDFLSENKEFINVVCTGQALSISPDTPLMNHPERFDIKLNSDGSVYYDERWNWESRDGQLTDEVRQERLVRLRSLIDTFPETTWS